jgi:hypothetical protein
MNSLIPNGDFVAIPLGEDHLKEVNVEAKVLEPIRR